MTGPRGWNPRSEEERAKEMAALAASDEWAQRHFAVFGSGNGRDLLDKYHSLIVESVNGPETSEAALRYREGQRALIVSIERLVAKGLAARPK